MTPRKRGFFITDIDHGFRGFLITDYKDFTDFLD